MVLDALIKIKNDIDPTLTFRSLAFSRNSSVFSSLIYDIVLHEKDKFLRVFYSFFFFSSEIHASQFELDFNLAEIVARKVPTCAVLLTLLSRAPPPVLLSRVRVDNVVNELCYVPIQKGYIFNSAGLVTHWSMQVFSSFTVNYLRKIASTFYEE